jgi:hypothetical protein
MRRFVESASRATGMQIELEAFESSHHPEYAVGPVRFLSCHAHPVLRGGRAMMYFAKQSD